MVQPCDTVYCDQMDHNWRLWNDNYNEMVNMLIKIAKNSSMLRIEAPEWYSEECRDKNGKENMMGKTENDTDCKICNRIKNNAEVTKEERWNKHTKIPCYLIKYIMT